MQRHDARRVLARPLRAVPGHAVAQAAQTPAGGGDLGFQQLAHARADGQVAAADDALGDAAGSVVARSTHRRDAVDELDLAQRGHLARAVLAVHRAAFKEDGRDDVVPAADIGQQFGQQIAAAMRRVPEMVVRIDDRQIRLQRRFGGALRQPRLQRGIVAIRCCRDIRLSSLRPGAYWFPPLALRRASRRAAQIKPRPGNRKASAWCCSSSQCD